MHTPDAAALAGPFADNGLGWTILLLSNSRCCLYCGQTVEVYPPGVP